MIPISAVDVAMLHEGLAGIAALQLPGLLAMNVGCDLGLRDGGWTFAITNDWQDGQRTCLPACSSATVS